MARLPLLAAAALAAGCTSAPTTPTWQTDVEPILESNCIRCHGFPALGGAPPTFRLDVYDSTIDPATGRTVFGAAAMSQFIAARTGDGSMPPRFPLVGDATDVLANWDGLRIATVLDAPAQPPPRGGARAGNHPPTIAVTPGAADGELTYQIDDADFEVVHGELALDDDPANPVTVATNLHAGRGAVAIDTSLLTAGDHPMHAALDDGGGAIMVPLAPLHVARTGDAPPHVDITNPDVAAPLDGDILADADSPFTISFVADDLDAGDTLTATIQAIDLVHPGAAPVAVTTGLAVTGGAPTTFAWDTTGVPAGPDWALEIAVGDGTLTTTVRSSRFVISHATTTETFGSICSVLKDKCSLCHGPENIVPGLAGEKLTCYQASASPTSPCSSAPDDNPTRIPITTGAYDVRGLVYLHTVVREDMPPVSAKLISPTGDAALLTDGERQRLAAWLLAGAPRDPNDPDECP
jgi:hypothetical protein